MVFNMQNIVMIKARTVIRAVNLYKEQVNDDAGMNDTMHHSRGKYVVRLKNGDYVVRLKNGDLIYVTIGPSEARVLSIVNISTPT